jgi:exopolysaccharide biosynthesis polyprenyl glycosylphosphotransferase
LLREIAKILGWALAAVDFLTVALAYLSAALLLGPSTGLGESGPAPMLLLTPVVFVATLRVLGAYRSFRVSALLEEIVLLGRAVLVAGAALLALSWLLRLAQPLRSEMILFLALAFVWLACGRLILRTGLRLARSRGYNLRNFVIVGSGRRAQEIARELSLQSYWGMRLIGRILCGEETHAAALEGSVLGRLPELGDVLEHYVVDGVFFAAEEISAAELREALACCRQLGIRALVDLHAFEEVRGYLKLSELAHSPVLIIGQTRLEGHRAFLKRAFDLVVAGVALILCAPLMLLVAALVRTDTPGPVLFRQQRVGMNGRRFTMLKFRTMVAGAERLRTAMAEQNEMDGPVFKIRCDPRLTRIGRYLRRSSLDELPQLWNVLRGDMSIVGPRPPLPQEVHQYQSWQRRRLSVRPGLTCLWQVSGRNDIGFERWMKMDLEYIDNWSWGLDLKILLRTLPAMVRGQ